MLGEYDIFDSTAAIKLKDDAIDLLFGYPDEPKKTKRYRRDLKHPTKDLWAGIVGNDLISACINMMPEQRANYYDKANLKTEQYLKDNGWFPEDP